MALISLSETRTEQLIGLLDWWASSQRRNSPLRNGLPELPKTGETYIAYPKTSAGIAGIEASTTTDSIGKAGQAECDIYQIIQGATDAEILPIGKSQTVYNISGEVGQDPIIVQRDKFGKWLALVGGSPSATIRFEILSASFSIGLGVLGCDYVNAKVTHVSCGYTGVAVNDEVQIFDPEYCHFNLPIELLVGLRGTATLMDADFFQYGLDLDCIYETISNQSCIWMIDTLCCAEEETIV